MRRTLDVIVLNLFLRHFSKAARERPKAYRAKRLQFFLSCWLCFSQLFKGQFFSDQPKVAFYSWKVRFGFSSVIKVRVRVRFSKIQTFRFGRSLQFLWISEKIKKNEFQHDKKKLKTLRSVGLRPPSCRFRKMSQKESEHNYNVSSSHLGNGWNLIKWGDFW